MPITVLGSTFGRMTEMYEEDLARFNMEVDLCHACCRTVLSQAKEAFCRLSGPSASLVQDFDKDGVIDEEELRDFVRTMKREARIRTDIDTSILALMKEYDPNNNGVIEPGEFKRLQREIVIERKDPILELRNLVLYRSEAHDSQLIAMDAKLQDMDEKVNQRLGALEEKVGLVLEKLAAAPAAAQSQSLSQRRGSGPCRALFSQTQSQESHSMSC